MLKIAITGHRDIKNTEQVREDIVNSLEYFQNRHSAITGISQLAAGADTIFAQEILKKGFQLDIIIPFDIEEYKKDFNERELTELNSILANRKYKVETELGDTEDTTKNDAYLKAGKTCVDEANIVFAVWDRLPAKGKGGTADIVAYAQEKDKQLHIIKAIRKSSNAILKDDVQETFDQYDEEAKIIKEKRFEPAWITGIFFGLIAVISFALALSFKTFERNKFYFSFGETICLIISFLLLSYFAKKYKKQFVDKRRGAEYLRTILWYKNADIPIPAMKVGGYKPESKILDLENAMVTTINRMGNLENAKQVVWRFANEQIRYHNKKRLPRLYKREHAIEFFLTAVKYLFLIIVGFTLLLEAAEQFEYHPDFNVESCLEWLKFFWIILPPFYAALEGIKYFGEINRNIAISHRMVTELDNIKEKTVACITEDEFKIIAKELRETLELENNEWALSWDRQKMEGKV